MAFQKITSLIVGVDLSSYSKIVVTEAKVLSQKLKIDLIYVYVFQDIVVFTPSFEIKKPEVSRYYEEEVRRKYLLKKSDKVLISFGRPFEELITIANLYKHAMIIVGHRGHNPIVRYFVGSTAERLASHSPVPLWIHRGQKIIMPKKILIPCDLSGRTLHTISEVHSLKKILGSRFELYHVIQSPIPVLDFKVYSQLYKQIRKSDNQKLKAFKKKYPFLKTVRATGGVVDQIEKRAKDFDMIAISPRDKKHSVPLFGSVTLKLLRSGNKPILVVP